MLQPSFTPNAEKSGRTACPPEEKKTFILDEIRAGALELAWAVTLAGEVAADGKSGPYCSDQAGSSSEEQRCLFLDKLAKCCRAFGALRKALEAPAAAMAGPDFEAWLTIVTNRPILENCLSRELKEELVLCKQAFFAAMSGPAWRIDDFRATIAKTSLPNRIKTAMCLLPAAVISPAEFINRTDGQETLFTGSTLSVPGDPLGAGKLNDRAFALAMQELEEMVGLETVKQRVRTYANLVRLSLERQKHGDPPLSVSMNFVFKGNPGTGKTTVARCLGRILKTAGLLESGHLVEVDRAGLVAGFVGQSEAKSEETFRKALGGVLFIDEAYSLTASGKEDFGRRALEVILKAMEDNRGKIAVVVAGYPKLMDQFIASNPGLQSRFTEYIDFPDYSAGDLTVILGRMLERQKFRSSPELLAAANVLLALQKQKAGQDFGNGREVRNMVEELVKNHANTIAYKENRRHVSRQEINSIQPADLPFQRIMGRTFESLDLTTLRWKAVGVDGSSHELDLKSAGELFAAAVRNPSVSSAALPQLVNLEEWQGQIE